MRDGGRPLAAASPDRITGTRQTKHVRWGGLSQMTIRTAHRDALRLLFAIRAGAQPLGDANLSDEVGMFRGEARLWAFDFWIRNPDYLAAELLDLYAATGDASWLTSAESIFDNEEPDLRRVPMIRYFFGAFDRLDDALALLRSRDLVRITGVKSLDKVRETDFVLTNRGDSLCKTCPVVAPVLQWYGDRAELVAKVAGDRGGAALKEAQYKRAAYAETELGGIIPSIAAEVARRLAEIKAAA